MRRLAILTVLLTALSVVGSFGFLRAFSDAGHPFSTTWCESPVVVPLASEGGDGVVIAAPGVSVARGAEVTSGARGPAIRLNDRDSRAQVNFGQTLFHTQWLFSGVSPGDAIRTDALIGDARQSIEASSVRGALAPAYQELEVGLLSEAIERPTGTGEIDLFRGATEVLFTNEGDTPIELIAAVGCPAIELEAQQDSAPVWDRDTQRFVAEHTVRFHNQLANNRVFALRALDSDVAGTVVEDISLNLDVSAAGFAAAEVLDVSGGSAFDRRLNDEFDGVVDTGLLANPLRLADSDVQEFSFTVAYTPNFDDPAWDTGIDVPAPELALRGRVDSVQVGLSALLRSTGADVDRTVSPSILVTPEPGLVLELDDAREPVLNSSGRVELAHDVVITNNGDTLVEGLSVDYPLVEMFGPGTVIESITARGGSFCVVPPNEAFDGDASSVVLFDANGLGVGQRCTISLEATLVPGTQAGFAGTVYDAPLTVTAQSGARTVRDASSMRAELAQVASVDASVTNMAITNLEDGRYQVDGTIVVRNTGDLDVSGISIAADVERPRTAASVDSDTESEAVVESDGRESASVFFTEFAGDDNCVGAGAPSQPTSSVFVSGGGAVAQSSSCEVDFTFITIPGASLEDWSIAARVSAPLTAVQPELADTGSTSIEFPEAPAIESSVSIEPVVNNGNGTYSVRSTVTITNSGDKPLTSVVISDSVSSAFGAQLISHERVGDSCSGISGRFPLPTAAIAAAAGGSNACTVTNLSLIEPRADLDGDTIEIDAVATSTSLVEVESSVESDRVSFTESPRIRPTLDVESVERIDERTVAIVLAGSLQNDGDVEARDVQAQLDLDDAFEAGSSDVPFQVQFISVEGLNNAEDFDGVSNTGLLTGTETIGVDGTVDFRVLVHATPDDEPGPFLFTLRPSATSPANADIRSGVSIDTVSVPIIGIVSQSIEAENNNDGTYLVTHSVTAENGGNGQLEGIQVFTNFEQVLGDIALGDINLITTCTTVVPAGEQCEVSRTATVRPGSNVGPYDVSASVAAADAAAVSALITSELEAETGSASLSGLEFAEAPGIELAALVSDAENNGDGTYTLEYEALVTNTGDVPLYRVGVGDFVGATFDGSVVADQVNTDTCSPVSFAQPLAPEATCERTHTVTIRPLENLGPWNAELVVNADTPAFARLDEDASFDAVTFTEDVAIDVDNTLTSGTNNGDGTYTPTYEVTVTNTGNVPIISLAAPDGGLGYGDSLLNSNLLVDSCTVVSFGEPLLPGAECRIEQTHLIAPGSELGPFRLEAEVLGASASGAQVSENVESNEITFRENPVIELDSEVASVETLEDGTFRVVQNLTVTNDGDVRIDDLALNLDLDQVFPDIPYRLDGAVSNEFIVEEAFTVGESQNLLAPEQSLIVGASGTITLVLSVEPGSDVGPFVGDLRAAGTSPGGEVVVSVVTAQLDLPSVAVAVLAQSVENNRDGSYTVTSSYEVTNDGTTELEFVRLTEDLGAIYGGAPARLLSIDGDGLPVADLDDDQRSDNLIEWAASLPSGQSAILTSTVLVEPGNILGPFVSTVTAQGASPTGTLVAADGTSTDEIEFVEQPALRVEQQLEGRPVWAGDRFEVTFAVTVVNDGDVELRGVQVREDLLNALGGGSQIIVRDIRSETLAVNRNFDGLGQFPAEEGEDSVERSDLGDTRLLSGGDTLAAGASATIELDLVITPETRGVYSTRVVVSARTPSGADLGAGDEQIEANTLTRLSVQGELGVAKQTIGDAVLQPNGSIAVTYEILVENAGPFPLDNVAVHDQLSQAFGVGSTFETSPIRVEPGSPCDGFASTSYDGGTVDSVLARGFELQSGQRCRLQFDAVVVPSIPLPGPYRSSAFAIATDPFSGTVLDDSTDGTNPDPDGNQEPGDNDIATPVNVIISDPSLRIDVESLPSGALDASGRFELGYRIAIINDGAVDIESMRLIADLEEAWGVDFETLSVESDDLILNDDFDGSRETNLLDRRSSIGAGAQAVLTLRVRAVRPDSGDLNLDLDLDGVSVAGVAVSAQLSEPVAANGPDGADQTNLLDTLTTQEKRLLGLGSAVILLFLGLFVRSLVRKARVYRDARIPEEPPALPAVQAAPQLPAHAADDLYIDLRTKNRPAERPTETAPEVVLDLTDRTLADRHSDEHHKSRRRRGRRPRREVES